MQISMIKYISPASVARFSKRVVVEVGLSVDIFQQTNYTLLHFVFQLLKTAPVPSLNRGGWWKLADLFHPYNDI